MDMFMGVKEKMDERRGNFSSEVMLARCINDACELYCVSNISDPSQEEWGSVNTCKAVFLLSFSSAFVGTDIWIS